MAMSWRTALAAAALAAASLLRPGDLRACDRCADFDFLCCDIPADNLYVLTSFSGEGMACGGTADGTWYYSTSWVRWTCDARLAVTNPDTGECVVVQVADAGPADWVEENAGMPIIDASPLVCGDLFDSGSCGWSDMFIVHAVQVPDDTPLGPGGCPAARVCETVVAASGETIIDDTDACFTKGCRESGGAWWDVGAGYGGDAVFTYGIDEAEGDCWGQWELTFETAGDYDVSVHVPDMADKTRGASYEITHAGVTDTVPLDQSAASGWALLGPFTFDTAGGMVRLTDRTGEAVSLRKKVVFDAVRLAPALPAPDEPAETAPDEAELPAETDTGPEPPPETADVPDAAGDALHDGGSDPGEGDGGVSENALEGGCACSLLPPP